MAIGRGTANGSPVQFVRGIEVWWTTVQMGADDLAVVGLATVHTNTVEAYGFRNFTFYFHPGLIAGPTYNVTLEELKPWDEATVVRTQALFAAIAAGPAATWQAIDVGVGTATLPGAVFGIFRVDITETAGNPGIVNFFQGARH
jgi:hypothetical protein